MAAQSPNRGTFERVITLRTVQDPADSESNSESARRSTGKIPRAGSQLIADAAKRALTPSEAAKTLESFRQLCVTKEADARVLEETAEKLRLAGYKQELAALGVS